MSYRWHGIDIETIIGQEFTANIHYDHREDAFRYAYTSQPFWTQGPTEEEEMVRVIEVKETLIPRSEAEDLINYADEYARNDDDIQKYLVAVEEEIKFVYKADTEREIEVGCQHTPERRQLRGSYMYMEQCTKCNMIRYESDGQRPMAWFYVPGPLGFRWQYAYANPRNTDTEVWK